MKIFTRLERFAAGVQGKGTGAFTAEFEALTVKKLLSKNGHPAPKIIFDVGANVGDWTQAAIPLFEQGRFFLFEPSQANIETLKKRFTTANVTVFPCALSNNEGKTTLFSDSEGSGLASLHKRRLDHWGIDHAPTYEVPTRTINEVMRTENIGKIDVLKMDVEGHELSVLQGAGERLDQISAIQFEFGGCNIDSRTFFQDFWYLLASRFAIYRLSKFQIERISHYSESDEFFATTNYVAINKNGSI